MNKLTRYKCRRCGYQWIPRTEKPQTCPKCRSPYWYKSRKKAKHRESWFIKKEVEKNERKENKKEGKEAGDKN